MPDVGHGKYLVSAGWDDVPHLTQKAKDELLRATPVHLRKARSLGTPSLGAGAIFPLDEEEFVIDDFQLPRHFKRGYAMDVGWKRTAALFGAYDQETDTDYFYACHYRGQAEPIVHASAIHAKGGKWMTGCIDPAARGRSQIDGQRLWSLYTQEPISLKLVYANKGIEAGLQLVWERLSSGRIKVFRSLSPFFAEYRIYRRDEQGQIVKENDHLMDCFRYWETTKEQILTAVPSNLSVYDKFLARRRTNPLDPYIGI